MLEACVRDLFVALSVLLGASTAFALTPGAVMDNFNAIDHQGTAHTLYASADRKAIVLMVQGNGCPIVRLALPGLKEIRSRYQQRGVEFLLLNSNLQDTRELVAQEAQKFAIDFPILLDQDQRIGEALQVVRTSEVFVIEPRTWKLVYRGPIDDRLSYEKQKPAEKHYLTDALDAVLAGRPVKVASADGVGCLVNFPDRKDAAAMPPMDHSKH